MEGNDALSQILLSFSRSVRESPGWLHKGNDNVLLCPCVRDSTGYWRTPLNDGEFEPPRPRIVAMPLTGGSPLREDDGGKGDPRASTVGLLPLTGGLRRRKVRGALLPPHGESLARSLAPPFRTRSASLGSRPRQGAGAPL